MNGLKIESRRHNNLKFLGLISEKNNLIFDKKRVNLYKAKNLVVIDRTNTFVFVMDFAHTYVHKGVDICVGKICVKDNYICLPFGYPIPFLSDKKLNNLLED